MSKINGDSLAPETRHEDRRPELNRLLWRDPDTAPKNGEKFIGLFDDGLVFKAWRQKYNKYKAKGDGGYIVDGHSFEWAYEESTSINGGKLVGWMPLP